MGKFDRQDLEVRARHVLVPTQMEVVEYGFLSIGAYLEEPIQSSRLVCQNCIICLLTVPVSDTQSGRQSGKLFNSCVQEAI